MPETGPGRPDIEGLFRQLAASTSYEQFSALVGQAQGRAGLMRFLELELDHALTLDPQAADKHRLVRLIAGNPVTMGQMTRTLPDAGSYAPVTIDGTDSWFAWGTCLVHIPFIYKSAAGRVACVAFVLRGCCMPGRLSQRPAALHRMNRIASVRDSVLTPGRTG